MTTIPPRSATKIEVGTVSSPRVVEHDGRALLLAPASQTALPNAFAPPNQSFHAGSFQCGGTPQWSKSFRFT